MTKRQTPPTPAKRSRPRGKSSSGGSGSATSTLYKDFTVWTKQSAPSWHPIKKMRYVFFRMINGRTVTDALHEIHWSASEFWHLIDLKRNDPFRVEYDRAKKLQARAMADSVVTIAEGRDRITKRSLAKLEDLITKGFKKIKKEKSGLAVKALVESLLIHIDANDTKIIQRNKLQIDSAKWMAKTLNPAEFGEASKLSLGGSGEGGDPSAATPILIQFVGPDGRVVEP